MDSPLIGILLVGETSLKGSHLGLVNIPMSSRNKSLSDFRNTLADTLKHLKMLNFLFITPYGWEINIMMEDTVSLSDIISEDGVIKVRVSYPKPKYGISLETNTRNSVPAGFLFCESDTSIAQLKNEIKQQLPSVHQFLLSVQFAFLDLNGWPIGKHQEKLITILEVASSNIVRISIAWQAKDLQQQMSLESIDHTEKYSGSQLDISASILQPISESVEYDKAPVNQSLATPNFDARYESSVSSSFEILLSYVHTEASSYALLLKTALEENGYSVFLDVHCIQGGTDWQDTLNDAISNCSLFVPLITPQYGQTLWTNREVKLADVLGKVIIPVNFLSSWPPKCLAIQFATTQFVAGLKSPSIFEMPDEIEYEIVLEVARDISKRYSAEKMTEQSFDMLQDEVESFSGSLSRNDTLPIDDTLSDRNSTSSTSVFFPGSPPLLRKKSAIYSYASALPSTLSELFRKTLTKPREGKPLIVISCAQQQQDFAHNLADDLKMKEYEIWCSCDIDLNDDEENARVIFQQKADEAGVVIFILSEEFASSSFCEQQVYYCEQRKRIIPIIYKPIQLPSWMAMLIGTNAFISCQASSYKSTLFERIDTLFNPQKVENELKQMLKQKIKLANMCSQLSEQLPKGKLVYISGGTQFFSKNGKAVSEALGKKLAEDDDIILITGGFYGVGETVSKSFLDERAHSNEPHGVCHVVAVRDKEDKSKQTRQNSDGTFAPVPFGDTLFFGDSVREREMLTPRVIDTCILIEGGPGAAFEAQQFVWNGNHVIPVKVTGGAAGGLFNVPTSIFDKPTHVKQNDWSLLADGEAEPSDIAAAIFRIVQAVKNPPSLTRARAGSTNDPRLRKRVSVKRSDTLPLDMALFEPLKQTLSETLKSK